MDKTTIQKINDSEIKEIIPQKPLEVIHNIDDLVKRRAEVTDQIESLTGIINDFDILIKKTKDAGCVENAEVDELLINKPLQEEVIVK